VNNNVSIAVNLSTRSPNGHAVSDSIANGTDDHTLVESIWEELNGRVDREQIRQAILEANARYRDATVKTFIPIFVRREVLKRLQPIMSANSI
jgi:hypothetical protein